jgi:folate-dependent phosphoribosylglycinamide formyltransferase PurN
MVLIMKIVLLTNDNYFSYIVTEKFLKNYKSDIALVVFSSALVGKRNAFNSILWAFKNTGIRHTVFKLCVYGVFKVTRILGQLFPKVICGCSTFLWVKKNNLKFITTNDVNAYECVETIKAACPDLIVSVSMNQVIKKEILELPVNRSINVHCAPLPKYGGMSPYIWGLANKENYSAATIHYMDEGLDTGDIIAQEKISVLAGDSAFCLFHRCCSKASELLMETIKKIDNGSVNSYSQDLSKKSYFSWPTKQSIMDLKKNGYYLAKFKDFYLAILTQKPRL